MASAPSSPVSASTAVTWRGQFVGYGGSAWQSSWGYAAQGSFGDSQLSGIGDPTTPGGGPALRVVYGQGSSANSCGNCPNPGGGQFYTSFADMGHSGFASAQVLYLRYYVKFQAGFDFGRGGKLPGLYGGPISQASGGHHGQAFSTRYMWRDHTVGGSLDTCSSAVACSEVYMYSPQVTKGYGLDLGGAWHWQGDGNWHMIEQRVDRATGGVTVWYDGLQVMSRGGVLGGVTGIPFSGIFFSTFFGGHDTSWGPSKTEHAYFADFAVSTRYIGGK
jgi:polysaccharide lyase-like protein